MSDRTRLQDIAKYLAGCGNLKDADFIRGVAKRAAAAEVTPAVPEGPDLREFTRWILSESLDAIDLCGGDIQDKAVSCGLLIETEVFEPCGEGCVCFEVGDFPLYCHRMHPSLTAAGENSDE